MKCPICNSEMTHQQDRAISLNWDYIVMESEYKCEHAGCGSYREYFSTGSCETSIMVNSEWIVYRWDYDTPHKEWAMITQAIEENIAEARSREYTNANQDHRQHQ